MCNVCFNRRALVVLAGGVLLRVLVPSAVAATPSEGWRTPAAKSGSQTTPRYDEFVADVRRVAR